MTRPAGTGGVPKMREIDFQRQLVGPTGIATMLGWEHVHFRPAQTAHGWRTPVSGELGKGWPDLVLVRRRDRRLLFAELKTDTGRLTPDEERVLETLASVAETHVWRPADIDRITETLR